jgi:hypothetical protein
MKPMKDVYIQLPSGEKVFGDMKGVITFNNIMDAKIFMTGSRDHGFDVTKIEVKVYTRRRKAS